MSNSAYDHCVHSSMWKECNDSYWVAESVTVSKKFKVRNMHEYFETHVTKTADAGWQDYGMT